MLALKHGSVRSPHSRVEGERERDRGLFTDPGVAGGDLGKVGLGTGFEKGPALHVRKLFDPCLHPASPKGKGDEGSADRSADGDR